MEWKKPNPQLSQKAFHVELVAVQLGGYPATPKKS